MNIILEDGKGTGKKAFVDSNNNLHVDSVSRTQSQQAALQGNAYNISTGAMTLTSANQSALWYLSYNGDDPLVIKEIGIVASASTGGSGNAQYQLVVNNDTTGTIISNAVAVGTNVNRNLGSAKTLDATTYKGAEGYTLTGGTQAGFTTRSAFDEPVIFDAEVFVLTKGTNIGVRFTPPAGNTSQTVTVFCTLFVETADINLG